MSSPVFSVLTPTYDRAHLLPRILDCLEAQTFRDFEWIVVDDGSGDETQAVLTELAARASFPVRTRKKANGGRHTAINLGVREARGELTALLDSDDLYLPNALERFHTHWLSIPSNQRHLYAGVTALCNDLEGNLIGSKFPKDVFDSDSVSIRVLHRVTGDKKGVIRTDLLKANPYPDVSGERRVPASLVWNRIATKYLTRFVNEVLTIMDYQKDSLSASIDRVRMRSPRAPRLYCQEYLSLGFDLPWTTRVKTSINYVRYSLHAGVGLLQSLKEAPSKALWAVSWPAGLVLFRKDKASVKGSLETRKNPIGAKDV